jgi:signal transduction histidine kinase
MSLKDKIINRFTVMLAIVAVAIISVVVGVFFYREATIEIETRTLETAKTVAVTFPRERILDLAGDNSDLNSESYRELKILLSKMVEVNREMSFAWLMGVNDAGEMFFFVDSDTSSAKALPGEVFPDTTPKMWETVRTGEARFDGASTDEWGTWVSAYASIKDDEGNFLALFGVDMSHRQYVQDIVIRMSPPILISLVFIGILVFVQLGMKRSRQQLEREKELLSVASHEVRSPMVSIKWVLDDILKHPEGLSEPNRSLIAALDVNAAKIIKNIEGILNSKSSGAVMRKNYEDIPVRATFDSIIDTLSLVAKEHRAAVRIDDSVTAGLIVQGDRESLNHAFYNVVNNALKYTRPGTEVVISYERSGKYHQIKVGDHGPGVKPEDREKIFDGLYRTEEALETKQPGTGLGLYFVKKIVNDHKGNIFIDPNYTDGTQVVIELPV